MSAQHATAVGRKGRTRHLSLLLAAVGGASCGEPRDAPPRAIELEQIAPKEGPLFLNHPLVFGFSEAVAPTSITSGSLRIESADGHPARGVFRIEGRQVQFLPDPPLSSDLRDGGFLPGTRYEVRVAGFPLPDGIHAADGSPLRCSYRWSFTTVPISDSPRDMFRDRTLGYSEPLRLVGGVLVGGEYELSIPPEGPIALECDEPLNPASVRLEDFTLRRLDRAGPVAVPIELELVENQDAGDPFPQGVARLEIRPLAPLEEGLFLLAYASRPTLTDLGGNTVHFWPRPIGVRVLSPVGEHVERFLDDEGRSPLPVPEADGTAWWGGGGVVGIRLPRAAGDGRDGELVLEGVERRKDLRATRLTLPEAAECELAAEGLVILRAQGALRISGRLARRGGSGPPVSWRSGERLSDWLERAIAEDPSWTVLVAGGDLVIDGEVETDGPLVLIAGGWIRASGTVRQEERQLWLLGEGGGMLLDPTRSSLDLEIDPPIHNPLATTLRFAVLSVPLPAEGRVGKWLGADAHGRAGSGSWSVRYLPFRAPGDAPPPSGLGPVDDPRLLDPPGKLRLLIELEVGPPLSGETDAAWSPPAVDEVQLLWEWDRAEGAR